MIILDTHIWVWWVHDETKLSVEQVKILKDNELNGLGVSIISCWEVAKLVEYKRLTIPCSIEDWFDQALSYPGIHLLNLSTAIIIESTQLPGNFHKDPADQLIVATSRIYDYTLLTNDSKIINYPHAKVFK